MGTGIKLEREVEHWLGKPAPENVRQSAAEYLGRIQPYVIGERWVGSLRDFTTLVGRTERFQRYFGLSIVSFVSLDKAREQAVELVNFARVHPDITDQVEAYRRVVDPPPGRVRVVGHAPTSVSGIIG
jgi:hypothetical protein